MLAFRSRINFERKIVSNKSVEHINNDDTVDTKDSSPADEHPSAGMEFKDNTDYLFPQLSTTNDAPDEATQQQLFSLIAVEKNRMVDLANQIIQYNTTRNVIQLSSLMCEHKTHEKRLKRYQSFLSVMRLLPTEILTEIFLCFCFCLDSPILFARQGYKPRLTLCAVSKKWRAIVLDVDSLWTMLTLQQCSNSSIIVQRSLTKSERLTALAAGGLREYDNAPKDTVTVAAKAVDDAIEEFCKRKQITAQIQCVFLERRITLLSMDWQSPALADDINAGIALPWHRLTCLQMEDQHTGISTSFAGQFIAQCVSLIQCSICISQDMPAENDTAITAILLPFLTTLSIGLTYNHNLQDPQLLAGYSHFLDWLTLPALKYLSITHLVGNVHYRMYIDSRFIDFKGRSSLDLEGIYLEGAASVARTDSVIFIDFLGGMSSLSSMRFKNMAACIDPNFIAAMCFRPGEEWLAPNLSEIQFELTDGVEMGSNHRMAGLIFDMIESRMGPRPTRLVNVQLKFLFMRIPGFEDYVWISAGEYDKIHEWFGRGMSFSVEERDWNPHSDRGHGPNVIRSYL